MGGPGIDIIPVTGGTPKFHKPQDGDGDGICLTILDNDESCTWKILDINGYTCTRITTVTGWWCTYPSEK
jgi:hypothetical protein